MTRRRFYERRLLIYRFAFPRLKMWFIRKKYTDLSDGIVTEYLIFGKLPTTDDLWSRTKVEISVVFIGFSYKMDISLKVGALLLTSPGSLPSGWWCPQSHCWPDCTSRDALRVRTKCLYLTNVRVTLMSRPGLLVKFSADFRTFRVVKGQSAINRLTTTHDNPDQCCCTHIFCLSNVDCASWRNRMNQYISIAVFVIGWSQQW